MKLLCAGLGFLLLALAVSSSPVIINDICANISESLMTPFNIGFPGYPSKSSLSAGQSCHCRLSIEEPYTFSFSVKNFNTLTRDELALKWNEGETQVVSEAGKDASNITLQHLRELTLSFTPAKVFSGIMLLGVDGERPHWRLGNKIEWMNLKCQDRPFLPVQHNACGNISQVLKTPFFLNSPGYPEPFSFSAGESCHCRMFTVEPYGFSLLVKKFETELRDGLALNWYDWNNSTGKKYVISEAAQNVTDVTTNLKDLTLSFEPVKGGSGEFLIEVASDRMDIWNQNKIQVTMNLFCQDHPFQLKTGAGETRLRYILFNAIPIAVIVLIGLIVVVPLLFMLCFGKAEKSGPHYKLGEVDPTITIPAAPVTSTSSAGYHQVDQAAYKNKSFE